MVDRSVSTKGLRCAYSGNLAISYDGFIYPCCSPEVFSTELKIGSFYKLSLKEALDKINKNSLLYLLRNFDIDIICGIAKNIGLELPKTVVNSCELCSYFFNKENVLKFLPYVRQVVKEKSLI